MELNFAVTIRHTASSDFSCERAASEKHKIYLSTGILLFSIFRYESIAFSFSCSTICDGFVFSLRNVIADVTNIFLHFRLTLFIFTFTNRLGTHRANSISENSWRKPINYLISPASYYCSRVDWCESKSKSPTFCTSAS